MAIARLADIYTIWRMNNMCRIAILTNPIKINNLDKWLEALEKSGGGDGNGIAYVDKGKIKIEKSMKMTTASLSQRINKNKYALPILFHTRKVSKGGKTDELCHPFYVTDNLAIVHNGTWTNYEHGMWTLLSRGFPISSIKEQSDTSLTAILINEFGIEILDIIKSGIWVTMDNKRKFTLYAYSSNFEMGQIEDGTWVYASDLSGVDIVGDIKIPEPEAIVELGITGPNIIRGQIKEKPKIAISTHGKDGVYNYAHQRGRHAPIYIYKKLCATLKKPCDFCDKIIIHMMPATIIETGTTVTLCETCADIFNGDKDVIVDAFGEQSKCTNYKSCKKKSMYTRNAFKEMAEYTCTDCPYYNPMPATHHKDDKSSWRYV